MTTEMLDETDPLDGLIDQVIDDPGAPFVPEALERLSARKKRIAPLSRRYARSWRSPAAA